MSSEEILIQTRKDKHEAANGGQYALAQDCNELPFIREHTVRSVVNMMAQMQSVNSLVTSIQPSDLELQPKIRLRGRITNFRKSGGITFIRIADSTGAVQLIVSKSSYEQYGWIQNLDLGDIIEASGWTCQSKTAEKSLLLFSVRLLTKAVRPPPEKFNGIADQELKYRKRYLDLMSNEESRARFTVRTHIIRALRQYMEERRFLEVETSTLNTIASGANAKPFTTHHNALDIPLTLRIAPELYLKRLLVGGLDRVFEIGRNYRNEGIDTRHNPEFTMMESYEAYGNFQDLIVMTKAMLRSVDDYCFTHLPDFALSYYQQWKDTRPFSWSQFTEVTMIQAVLNGLKKAELEFELGAYFGRTPNGEEPAVTQLQVVNPNNDRLQRIDLKGLFHALGECSSIGDQIAVLFEFVAEPFLTDDYRSGDGLHSQPVFITEYPKEISPLARERDDKPGITDRFELFVEGRELANAFQELNDPEEQAARFQDQLESNEKDPMAYDADYVEALEHGMPPAIGFGMGIDRLVMLVTNTSSIKDVILFPTLKPQNNV